MFSSLQEQQKFVYISADEIYVKPAVRFRASNVIGFAQNQDTPTPARTVLALMINFLRGTPAFVARLIPVVNLKHAFLVDLLLTLVEIIHQAGGYVFGVVTDNLSVNQKAFKSLRETYTPNSICSVNHPIDNEYFSSFYTLYDTTHLMKNIRNNWITEKIQTLEFLDPITNNTIVAKWKDVIDIYKIEEHNMARKITLNYPSLYPNNFEKQKVQLVINVFNEKTVACLEQHGRKETAQFVALITRMWNILNIKTKDAGRNLNDDDRMPFYYTDDPRLEFLLGMARSFKLMDSGKRGCRVRGLTTETANALHQTLHGIVDMIKHLLNSDYRYALPGKIQSDRLEAEFGIYRGTSGGNYFISVE